MNNYTTVWVPQAGADLEALRAQHQRSFPGNELAILNGWVKVAVPDGETQPLGAQSAPGVSVMAGNLSVNGG